ncbi:hypothetical protein HDV00_004152 [Rhizophlyctis rosea]|nr:hypothetical protein HDV00_004152 [Rhizophlyctis rosea]
MALKAIYKEVNTRLNENDSIDTYMSGTTVILALVMGEKVIISHVGDSRGVLYQEEEGKLTAKQLTSDHTCQNTTERERLESSGARVEQLSGENGAEGPLRIFKGTLPYPGLVVSRTLGDQVASKLGVLCEPDVSVVELGPKDKYLVLATDGVWDGLSMEEVTDILRDDPEAEPASKEICSGSLAGMDRLHLDDNTTNIVVRFKYEG